ncbi:hypothetical protein CSIM01_13873 [Colletotrichum simmondsii]|uniref:Uncharacterized protein n=1 Tax=Colletotrichum simmondsii TaxID=703756 RepID=A0A135SRZ7_9PEZI|nr:hypothetical protein CSIM01_13873 [Colletotrichum simmondsii]
MSSSQAGTSSQNPTSSGLDYSAEMPFNPWDALDLTLKNPVFSLEALESILREHAERAFLHCLDRSPDNATEFPSEQQVLRALDFLLNMDKAQWSYETQYPHRSFPFHPKTNTIKQSATQPSTPTQPVSASSHLSEYVRRINSPGSDQHPIAISSPHAPGSRLNPIVINSPPRNELVLFGDSNNSRDEARGSLFLPSPWER